MLLVDFENLMEKECKEGSLARHLGLILRWRRVMRRMSIAAASHCLRV